MQTRASIFCACLTVWSTFSLKEGSALAAASPKLSFAVPAAPRLVAQSAPARAGAQEELGLPAKTATQLVSGVRITGLSRTDEAWLMGYLGYTWPRDLSSEDIADLVRKVLTTAVYSRASATLEADPGRPDGGAAILCLDVTEKWTTIPVVRAAFGGGTPLTVLGLYDTHVMGRLWTVGSEMQKYGDAPPGVVLYARDPRSGGGRRFLGGDLWREFRRRPIYDGAASEPIGTLATSSSMAHFAALGPLTIHSLASSVHHRAGLDVTFLQETSADYEPEGAQTRAPPSKLALSHERALFGKLLPTYLYDDVALDNVLYDGWRLEVRGGPLFVAGGERVQSVGEVKSFHYKLLPHNFNSAVRVVAGASSSNAPSQQYFLGGLDAIRGIPDGAVFGSKAVHVNAELRHLTARWHYLWAQSLVFADAASAANDWHELRRELRATAGLGLRLAVPQVARLMLRIDYAWALDGSRAHGLTAGLNQFFDPYRPL